MTAMISRPPLSERLMSSKVIVVLRASHVSALSPVCDVLVEEGILSLELTLTTPGLLDALPELINRYANAADVGVGTIITESEAQRALDHGSLLCSTRLRSFPAALLPPSLPPAGTLVQPRSRSSPPRPSAPGISNISEARSLTWRAYRRAELASTPRGSG
jgi:hypothetical protein